MGAVASFVVGSLILRVYPVKQTDEELAMETTSATAARRRTGLTSERQRGTRRPAPSGAGRRIITSGGASMTEKRAQEFTWSSSPAKPAWVRASSEPTS